MVVSAVCAWAKGPANVANTIHNLSTSAPTMWYYSDNVTQICVFCHTPHGGRIEGPLWNRNVPAANGFTHYTSNTLTLQSADPAYTTGRSVGDESRLCLSCHDGSATLDHLINPPNEIGANPVFINGGVNQAIVDVPDVQDGVIGNLSDDHPISFSYDTIVGQAIYSTGARAGELHSVAAATTNGVRFFGANNRVECSSCHDPHVDYSAAGNPDYAPFLIKPNKGSNLCRACHNK
ncbi:MAG: hypothetical protein FDZ69_09875 [Deltaproteobacteria bacterium]|nr:MAG: hypothetical protein FDZ69_09875 [Deltaproteobacteria bacterium]